MKIGIIAEYNPFHNGHIYQINWIKKNYPNAKIIVILSSDYVQRGEIAIASFEERKKIAIDYGVDEVVELEFEYSTQAAHIFANGAILKAIENNIDLIVFGSETNRINDFYLVANFIKENSEIYYNDLKIEMKKGYSFPKANQLILEKHLNISFTKPNDILGLEYIKTIVLNNLNIKAICIQRIEGKDINNASNIRKMVFDCDDNYKKFTPMRFKNIPSRIQDHYQEFQKIVKNSTNEELKNIHLMSEGMENLFKKHIDAKSYDDFVQLTNSKRYTSSRIKRTILYVLLGIKKN